MTGLLAQPVKCLMLGTINKALFEDILADTGRTRLLIFLIKTKSLVPAKETKGLGGIDRYLAWKTRQKNLVGVGSFGQQRR